MYRETSLAAHILPKEKVISRLLKIVDMIPISSEGLRGEDDSRFQGLKPDRKALGKAGSHQIEKIRYGLLMESFQKTKKFPGLTLICFYAF